VEVNQLQQDQVVVEVEELLVAGTNGTPLTWWSWRSRLSNSITGSAVNYAGGGGGGVDYGQVMVQEAGGTGGGGGGGGNQHATAGTDNTGGGGGRI
jgi:hypothetical protein